MANSIRSARDAVAELDVFEQEFQSFSYMIAHDFSASMRHLLTFSRLLADDLGQQLNERQRTLAENLHVAGEQCAAMLEQLHVYAAIQQRAVNKSLVEATQVVRQAQLRLSGQPGAADAEICVEPLGFVHADADLIAQAIDALLGNAIKFHRPGVAPRVLVKPQHDDAFWRMRVTDNGIGVDPEFHEAVFVMFRKLNRPGAYPGVGAGLAICRRIARKHGGEARLVHGVDGACFELALPRSTPSGRRLSGHVS